MAGRDVLLKSVAHALPTYCMQCFLLPNSLLEELQRMMNSFWWGSKPNGARGIHWMSWDRLCIRKEFGGLSYRNLEGYNLAMLGKQGWKLIAAPDALSSRLLKAKYYPKKGFLNASLGSNPSFIWRSIWCSQAILARGTRWKIGDGKSINIGTDPWLRDPANFYIQTTLDEEHRGKTVNELIDIDLHQWQATTLQAIFEQRDIEEILKIPVPTAASEDIRLWHFSRDGCYTVKSGYRLLMTSIANPNSAQPVPGSWNRLWTVQVPPKVKFFIWKAVRNCNPCRQNLLSRHIDVPSICALCGSGNENNWHLFIDCPYAQACWEAVNLAHLVNDKANNSDSFMQWFFGCLECWPHKLLPTMFMTIWSIWKYRNDKFWNAVERSPRVNIRLAGELLNDWIKARQSPHVPHSRMNAPAEELNWKSPPTGFMKCNVDAAIFRESCLIGSAAVIRDSKGEFMVCRMVNFQGSIEVREAEAKALLDAITWAASLDMQQIIFETDSKIVVEAVHSNAVDRSEFGTIIGECCSLLSKERHYIVHFSRRQANMVAHNLARAAISHASPCVLFDAPSFIYDALIHDCNELVLS